MSRETFEASKAVRGCTPIPSGLRERERAGDLDVGAKAAGERGRPRHAFGRLRVLAMRAPVLQPKLKIGTPGDKYEREADHVADEVMRMPESADPRQTWPAGKSGTSGTASSSSGRPLDPATHDFMESRFGRSFHDVRIHSNSRAERSTRGIGARAYTLGQDIFFRSGQYAPDTLAGKRLLAHELTHVCQQAKADDECGSFVTRDASAPVVQCAPAEGKVITKLSLDLIHEAIVEGWITEQTLLIEKVRELSSDDRQALVRRLQSDHTQLMTSAGAFALTSKERDELEKKIFRIERAVHAIALEFEPKLAKSVTTSPVLELRKARRVERRRREAERKERERAELGRPFGERAGETGQITDFLTETQVPGINHQAVSERIHRELDLPIASRPTERALELALDVQNLKDIDSGRLRLPTSELEAAASLLLNFAAHKPVDNERARDQIDAAFSFVEGPLAAALIRARTAESEAPKVEAPTGPFAEVFRPFVEAENARRASRRLLKQAPLNYVDFFARATYDVAFRAERGRLSTKIQLAYPDGTELIVDLSEIKNETFSEDELRSAIANGKVGRSRRFFPDASLNRTTTPRLFRAAKQARIAMDDYNLGFILQTFPVVFDLLTGAAFSVGPVPTAPAQPRAAPRTPPRGTGTASTPGPRPRKALPPGKEPKGALPEPGRIEGGGQRTTPMNPPNPNVGPPAAFAKKAPRRADIPTKLATKAENDAALILEKNGFEVQQLKEKKGFLDLTITTRVGGKRTTRTFDVVAPTTSNVLNVMDRISEKVGKGQNRLVLYLRDSSVGLKELKAALLENPVITRGLDEILAITPAGEVVHFWP